MINPHLDVGPRPATLKLNEDGTITSTGDSSITLDRAILYANGAKDSYRQALGDEATFNSLLGVGLIGVATAVPILAVTGASTKSIGITAISGAGAYAVGTWLQSTPRQRAYVQGYNAINCAIEAVTPLRFDTESEPYQVFAVAVRDIGQQIVTVETKIGAVRGILAEQNGLSDRLRAVAEEASKVAERAVEEARVARKNGVSLQLEHDTVGANLVTAVDRIVGQVDSAIVENQPDLATLSSIIGGLGQIYGQLRVVPSGFPVAVAEGEMEAQGDAGPSLTSALRELQVAVASLAVMTRDIADFIAVIIDKKPVEKLAACGVDPDAIATDIAVEPSTASFTGSATEVKTFLIRGGARPYRVALLGSQSTAITVAQPDLFGPAFVVQVTKDAVAGPYSIYAADAAGRSAIVAIQVGAVSPAPSDDQSRPPVAPAAAGGEVFAAIADEATRMAMQKTLCTREDGTWGPMTRDALIEYQRRTNPTGAADGIMTDPLRVELINKAGNETEREAQCAAMRPARLTALQELFRGNTFQILADDPDFLVSVLDAVVKDGILHLTIHVPEKPKVRTVTDDDIRGGLLRSGQDLGIDLAGVTQQHLQIDNFEELRANGILNPA
jgi:hypothetical protein